MRNTSIFQSVLLAALVALGSGRTQGSDDKSIALILDASGSMQARLGDGQRRINAAKDAVEDLVGKLPDTVRLAFRAYGHQSHRRKKNCKDTQLLTGFQSIGANRADVVAKASGLKAQGYTPISLVLELAANDLKAESAAQSRVVVLVSDGKETCEGDPCAVAKALAEADASLVVHTIGFAVDVAARYQLQCIARVGRGTYSEADTTDKLTERLSLAVKAGAVRPPPAVKQKTADPGTLVLQNPTASRHPVIDIKTGKTVAHLSAVTSSVGLPDGFYNVKFGNMLWRSLEVRSGEQTAIETAIIELPNAAYKGHEILDWETGEVVGKLSSLRKSTNVLPSSYLVRFGTLEVPVTLGAGEVKTIAAGSVSFRGLPINSRSILDASGKEVTSVSKISSGTTLPPGKYVLDNYEQKITFDIVAGEHIEIELK